MILVIIIAISFVLIGVALCCMAGNDCAKVGHAWGISCVLGGLLTSSIYICEHAYRRGQIDAINGKIKFERVQNDDGETVWRERSTPSAQAEGKK